MTDHRRGVLVTLSGPSGVGKDTLINHLIASSDFHKFAAYTTRPPRLGETNGLDYRFITQEQFDALLVGTSFFDHLVVNGFSYGTPWRDFEEVVNSGDKAIVHLSASAALKLKGGIPSTIAVFVMPPSSKDLISRLRSRGMSDQAIEARLKEEPTDVRLSLQFDFIVVNHTGEESETAAKILKFIEAAK